MAKTKFQSVDEYIAAQAVEVREILQSVRRAIRTAVPKAQEVISYQIPAYKLNGKPVLYFAAWKQHFSIYPAIGGVKEAFQDEIARYEVSKGTIRFPLVERAPLKLIAAIAKFRAQEIEKKYRRTKA